MTAACLAFALGAALLQWQPALPGFWTVLLLPLSGGIALFRPGLAFVFTFTLGFLWAALAAHLRMADWLAPELEGRDLQVVGVVASLPAAIERGQRFELDIESADAKVPAKVLVSWYRGAGSLQEEGAAAAERAVHPGERWLLTLRLRRPHGSVNPHGFDYEAWLLERGIGATGYVRQKGVQKLLGFRNTPLDFIEKAREAIRNRFIEVLGPTPAAGILAALAVGDQRAISAEEWQLFNRTGVTHLMSIAGLHVTLGSGLLAWLAGAGWRRGPALALRLPARKAAAIAAIVGALGYTLLAGFAVPAQRTFYMVTVVAIALWCGRISSPTRVLALALAAVIAVDPWAPLAPGLWLSFGAVALIFYVSRIERGHLVLQWARVQWAVTLGLAPAALLLFGQVSVAGPIANAAAIPLVSAVVTPLALVAAVLPLDFLLHAAAWLVELLLQFLEWCAALPGALWQQHAPSLWSVALALIGVAWLLAPRGFPWRACGLALMAPAFALPPEGPQRGTAWIITFDVGQGLAVLVRTANRTLLYDAGPAFGAAADSGGRIVLPALRGAGLGRLDAMVLTHEDLDHVGGALTVLETLQVDALASSLPARHPLQAHAAARRACSAGERWEWDGVRFEFLHPDGPWSGPRRNDSSCVLRVTTAGGSMLLTGDIERTAERLLVEKSSPLRSDVLLVPHHGSRTSSTAEFIAAVAPRWAVLPVGYRSRFGHPAGEVMARYAAAGTSVLRTDLDGAVQVRLTGAGVEIEAERQRAMRYWRTKPRV